ncbi:UDP-N-acetylglucosamine--N-acetylmuramyl-(pentapeptide) pyrophosphoryl-undecaprenol N-acetylglucosamine transferase [Pseudoalteromonas piscicida]|uniref:UDP-N-acetylglucosamine--N-acetylmuramyl- (pentapeptide) pyrophosphoryl-undecaprenol N-acetylglucosamine transferase n=1 Tax=Pseudoalteromonas piscicida TaxID=43662 RepID=UPI0027E49FBE|nr:glycosyltransferase [Pseudoalteromonas piscicida]WMO14850.1 glycosyltransferase [Pseudoalteromonas piscicida]
MTKIVFAGGGSAGHALPSIRVALEIKKRGYGVCYLGADNSIEKSLCEQYDIEFYPIKTAKFNRSKKLSVLSAVISNFIGIFQAIRALRLLNVVGVFASGGFASFPVVVAARLIGIKRIIIHACDLSIGLSNKLCLPFSSDISCTFESTTAISRKAFHSGPIVDARILNICKNVRNKKPTLLLYGGSLGAQVLNKKIRDDLEHLLPSFNIIHICGKGNFNEAYHDISGYEQYEYVFDFADILAQVDVAICRAGSNSLWELVLTRTPHLAVPIPMTIGRGDQQENCQYFASKGVTHWIEQNEFIEANLNETVLNILAKSAVVMKKMKELTPEKSAVSNLAERLLQEN